MCHRFYLAAAAILVLSSVNVQAQTYHLTDLGTLGGTTSSAAGINASGQVVGSADITGDTASHAFVYSGGIMTDLGTLGGRTSSANSINDLGQITGSADLAGNAATHAFRYGYLAGGMEDLGTLGGNISSGSKINIYGQVAGSSYVPNANATHAFLYTGGDMNDLGSLSNGDSFGNGMTDGSDIIVGESRDANNNQRAFVWPSAVPPLFDIGTLGGSYASAADINNAEKIVGGSSTAGDAAVHAFVYTSGVLDSMSDLDSRETGYSFANAINNHDQVVGQFISATDETQTQRAFIYNGDTIVDLNSLLDNSGANWLLTSASDINDSGWIVGVALNPDGVQRAVLLTPVPEPSTFFLAALGVAAIFDVRRRSPHS